jgi:hypothetical protein
MGIKDYDAPILRALDKFDSTIAPKLGEALVTRYTSTKIERGWRGQETESKPFIAVVLRRGYEVHLDDHISNFELKQIYVGKESTPMSKLPETAHIRVINKETGVEVEYSHIEELVLGKHVHSVEKRGQGMKYAPQTGFRLVREDSGLEVEYTDIVEIDDIKTNDFLDAQDAAVAMADRYSAANPELQIIPSIEGSWDRTESPLFYPCLTFDKKPKNIVPHTWLDTVLPVKMKFINTTTN